jgi:inosine-uridine nucleoside N-ribohydrolase
MAKQKVIFDTDPGVDDAMALLFIERCDQLDLLGITSCIGNADIETTTHNALYLKQRFRIAAPVAKGAAAPIARPRGKSPGHIHGENGLGNVAVPEALDVAPDPRPAWQFIVDTVRANPGEVIIIAVGRMTNLALALQHDPGIAGLTKGVVIMGGAFGINGHSGNVTPVAEANIIGDPEAADKIMIAPWPVTIIGLDVTHETIMTLAYQEKLRDEGGEEGRFMWEITRHYHNFYRDTVGLDGFACHDSLAVAFVIEPSIFKLRHGQVRVATEGVAVGQTIQHHQRRALPGSPWDGHPPQTVAVAVDSQRFLDLYLDTFRKSADTRDR